MKTREEPAVPVLDVPDAIANAWAAVYIDVAVKLEAEQQAASAGQQDAEGRPVEEPAAPTEPPPGELCRATIADVDRANCVITLKEHKTVRKTGKPGRIPIGRKLGELLTQAIGERQAGPIFLSPKGKAWSVPNLSRTYSRLRDLV